MATVAELIARLGFTLTGQQNLDRFQSGLDRATATARGFSMAIAGIAAATGLVAGLTAVSRSFIDINSSLQSLSMRFNAVFGQGNEAAAQQALEWARQFGAQTALSTEQAASAFLGFKQVGIDPTNGALQGLTNAWVAAGGGAERFGRIQLALTQAMAAGRLQAQDANQLAQAGIPIWSDLGQVLGKTVGEVRSMSEAGQINNDVLNQLFGYWNSKYAGAATAYTRTWTGAVDKLYGSWERFILKIGDSNKSFQRLTDIINNINDWIEQNQALMDSWATSISNAIVRVIDAVAGAARGWISFGRDVIDVLSRVNDALNGVLGYLGIAAAALAAFAIPYIGPLLAIGAAIAAIGLVLEDVYVWLNGGQSAIGSFIAAFQANFPQATAAAQAVLVTLQQLWATIQNIAGFTYGDAAAQQSLNWDAGLKAALDTINNILQAVNQLLGMMGQLGNWLNVINEGVANAGQATNAFLNRISFGLVPLSERNQRPYQPGYDPVAATMPQVRTIMAQNPASATPVPASVQPPSTSSTSQTISNNIGPTNITINAGNANAQEVATIVQRQTPQQRYSATGLGVGMQLNSPGLGAQ